MLYVTYANAIIMLHATYALSPSPPSLFHLASSSLLFTLVISFLSVRHYQLDGESMVSKFNEGEGEWRLWCNDRGMKVVEGKSNFIC